MLGRGVFPKVGKCIKLAIGGVQGRGCNVEGEGGKGEGVFEVGSLSLSAHGVAALSSRIRGRGGEGRPQKLWFPRKEDEKVE